MSHQLAGSFSSYRIPGRAIDFPNTSKYQTIVADLHTHSVFSDGHVWPNIRVSEALRDDLDAIAITEHLEYQPHIANIPHKDRNTSYKEAKKAAQNTDLIIIAGLEITRDSPTGHINAIFLEDANQLINLYKANMPEAKKLIANDEVYIEKFFQNPRHIEVQILAGKNNVVHLHERDCSVQRRHQKLIEETPSPVLTEKQRKDLLEKTVKMVEQIGYEGAGTVEFIYENGKFYFLEMNTRVQVEHPVTEVQTGIDIVKEQLSVAFTGETALNQSDINPRGHSIECRINAENPALDFQPSPGTISVCHQPSGFRTRVDGSIFQGCKITPYYDSLIAKVICKGRNRTEAIQRTLRSLDEFVLEGITTTIDLHKKILNHEKFVNSSFDNNWLGKEKFY